MGPQKPIDAMDKLRLDVERLERERNRLELRVDAIEEWPKRAKEAALVALVLSALFGVGVIAGMAIG